MLENLDMLFLERWKVFLVLLFALCRHYAQTSCHTAPQISCITELANFSIGKLF
jgi:hypothetical protein